MHKPAVITLRPIVAQDREAFHAFVRGLSPESRINRFLVPVRELAPAALAALTQPDQARHVGLVALDGSEIVGEGRYVALADGGRGEFAIAVADQWQRQGIGTRLLAALTAAAHCAGIAELAGEILYTNRAMLNFMRRAGFRLRPCPGDASLVVAERELERAALSA
jgi:acetyltransferase